MELTGSRILLTGASGGLGQAIARRLARYGAHLTLTARNRPALDSLADETRGTVVEADLAKRSDVQKLVKICLLYTSPSPRDRTRSRMPSSA